MIRAVLIGFGLLVGAYIVAIVGLQFSGSVIMTATTAKAYRAVTAAEHNPDSEVPSRYEVENIADDRAAQIGFRALSSPDSLMRHRAVHLSTVVSLEDLLEPGEAQPDPDFAELLVKARVSSYGKAECARLMKLLASQCVVESAQATKRRDQLFNLRLVLTFVQKDHFGVVNEDSRLSYQEVDEVLPTSGAAVTTTRSKAEADREKLYRDAVMLCRKLREIEGNCAIYRLAISARDQGGGALELSGDLRLSFLQDARS